MSQNTASGRTVFVLGKQIHGNRQVMVYNSGEEYGLYDNSTAVDYTSAATRFPYDM